MFAGIGVLQMIRLATLVCGLLWCGLPALALGNCQSEPNGLGLRESVVDRAVIRGGDRLRGLIVSEKPLRFFVRTEWLKTNSERFFQAEVQPAIQKQESDLRTPLQELIRKELERPAIPALNAAANPAAVNAESATAAARRSLLEDLSERLQADANINPEWVLVELPRPRVQRLEPISGPRRELGRLGMLNRIPNLEEISAESVQRQLAGIPESERVLIFEGVAGELELPERVFERVLAAADLRSGGAARVIRTGGVCIDEESAGEIPALFGQMLQQNVEGALQELLAEASGTAVRRSVPNEAGVPRDAAAIAERSRRRALLISTNQMDPANGRAVVTQELYYRVTDGSWRLQLASVGEAGEGDIPAGVAEQLADDPQVQEVAKLAGVLGLGGDELRRAVGMGAVVQEALARSRTKLEERVQQVLTGRRTGGSGVPLVKLAVAAPGSP